ncbi:hypothetical protein [Amycolatopsis sp. NPDC049159]|uniref:hypothetical protein n=1 Tax=Amycolatopsis sp. NPDC049159 TaxID=3157210 RepID=UPI0033BFBEE4
MTANAWGPKSTEPDRTLTLRDQDGDLIAYNADEAKGGVGWRFIRVKGHKMNYSGVPWSDLDDEFEVSWPLFSVEPLVSLNAETQVEWGVCIVALGEVIRESSETEARRRVGLARAGSRALVRREVGPWTEVQS